MQERDMVLDILNGSKASLGNYAKLITECNDSNLRKTYQQMRDGDEKFQYQLYGYAAQKGYYVPSPPASPEDARSIKTTLCETQSNVLF